MATCPQFPIDLHWPTTCLQASALLEMVMSDRVTFHENKLVGVYR